MLLSAISQLSTCTADNSGLIGLAYKTEFKRSFKPGSQVCAVTSLMTCQSLGWTFTGHQSFITLRGPDMSVGGSKGYNDNHIKSVWEVWRVAGPPTGDCVLQIGLLTTKFQCTISTDKALYELVVTQSFCSSQDVS